MGRTNRPDPLVKAGETTCLYGVICRMRTCDWCDKPHEARGCCHSHYMNLLRHGTPIVVEPTREERFQAFVGTDISGCCPWLGAIDPVNGYGKFWDGKNRAAHVVALEIATGEQANGRQALHSCDRRDCVNHQHLRWGTHQDNMDDKSKRGRSKQTLTDEQVRTIRKSERSYRQLGADFGITERAIAKIKKRITYRFVDDS